MAEFISIEHFLVFQNIKKSRKGKKKAENTHLTIRNARDLLLQKVKILLKRFCVLYSSIRSFIKMVCDYW
jgi:hypothetical protein